GTTDDEACALMRQAGELYGSGNCEAALPLGEKAVEMLSSQAARKVELAAALVTQGLCHKRLGLAAQAERLYRQAIDIQEKTAGADTPERADPVDNRARP